MSKTATKPELELERAQLAVAEAKKRFVNTKGALQYRLKPANLASHAWEGVREKSGVAADGAIGAAREHPGTIGGAVAAVTLFLARDQIWRAVTSMFGRNRASADEENIIKADLENADANYDLTAPTVERSKTEGVIA